MTNDDINKCFLDDIADHPGDRTYRLIYADWLEDIGEPERAECLRWMANNNKRPNYWGPGIKKYELWRLGVKKDDSIIEESIIPPYVWDKVVGDHPSLWSGSTAAELEMAFQERWKAARQRGWKLEP